MKIIKVGNRERFPNEGVDIVYLRIDYWNDFWYVTMFDMAYHDDDGVFHEIGSVKVGFRGQTTKESTYNTIKNEFDELPDGYFSVGQDADYYEKIASLPEDTMKKILGALKDVAYDPNLLCLAKQEEVFSKSLLRTFNTSTIQNQFSRIVKGQSILTDFAFEFAQHTTDNTANISLSFEVIADSKPSTNIHAIIGRNGVGKTTILNQMILSILAPERTKSKFKNLVNSKRIDSEYFSGLVSVSFSVFDSFDPLEEQNNPLSGVRYSYVGLKKRNSKELKSIDTIHDEFIESLKLCFSQSAKRKRWLDAINNLNSDENFSNMGLKELTEENKEESISKARNIINRMSSGHAIVLLTITKLVACVEEKTLVLIDEPESHLHPPLLSAFIRALAELLYNRNGISIIATHSPVVLQEIPKSSVWTINRVDMVANARRPKRETFGENVGVLTMDVFGLEVVKSGFYKLLDDSVNDGKNYEEIDREYDSQLGTEARSLVAALIAYRDKGYNND